MNPSKGDASAKDLNLQDWLLERQMRLEALARSREMNSEGLGAAQLVKGSSAECDEVGTISLRMSEVRQLGCFAMPGGLNALVTPLGALNLEEPTPFNGATSRRLSLASRKEPAAWTLPWRPPIRRPPVERAIGHYLWLQGAQAVGYVFVVLLKKRLFGMNVFNGLQLAMRALQVPVAFYLLLMVAHNDIMHLVQARRMPLPLVIRNGPFANGVIALLWACLGYIFIRYSSGGFRGFSCEPELAHSCALATWYAYFNLLSVAPVAAVSVYQAVFVLAIAAMQAFYAPALEAAQLTL